MPSWQKKSLLEMIDEWDLHAFIDEWTQEYLISGSTQTLDEWLWVAVNYHIMQEMES